MDDIARYNLERWRALAKANAVFARPQLDLDADSARQLVDPERRFGEIAGKKVLCLASGGGKQSAAFGVLGASVTVFDLSAEQLANDQVAAQQYGFTVQTVQGDMRDLSALDGQAFDIVAQAFSLNFVPEAEQVFREVRHIMKVGGIYTFQCANPFFSGLTEKDWNGEGYTLKHPYVANAEIQYEDSDWVYDQSQQPRIQPPKEYRHTLSGLVRGLVGNGFVINHISDSTDFYPDSNAKPGSWEHFLSIVPPWLTFWITYQPSPSR